MGTELEEKKLTVQQLETKIAKMKSEEAGCIDWVKEQEAKVDKAKKKLDEVITQIAKENTAIDKKKKALKLAQEETFKLQSEAKKAQDKADKQIQHNKNAIVEVKEARKALADERNAFVERVAELDKKEAYISSIFKGLDDLRK